MNNYKRRRLNAGQKAIIIYDVDLGFVEEIATFIEYRSIIYNEVPHEIPVFKYRGSEISGLKCFWVLPEDIKTRDEVQKFQYNLMGVQLAALEIGYALKY